MSNWEKLGTIAAVVAAVAAVGAFAVAWIYGRRASHDSTKAVKYERLREARDLVSIIRIAGDNTRFADCNDACARLGAILTVIGGDFPHTRRLTDIEWNLDLYGSEQFPTLATAARDELDKAVETLESAQGRHLR